MSEAKLIGRARQGDEAAWEILVRQHQEAAFRLAYLLLGDADEAEDVAQETFIRAFRSLDRFDPDRPLRSLAAAHHHQFSSQQTSIDRPLPGCYATTGGDRFGASGTQFT